MAQKDCESDKKQGWLAKCGEAVFACLNVYLLHWCLSVCLPTSVTYPVAALALVVHYHRYVPVCIKIPFLKAFLKVHGCVGACFGCCSKSWCGSTQTSVDLTSSPD